MTTRRLTRSGPMVPLERAAGSKRLPALDPKGARQNDIARKFRAVVTGKPLPRRPVVDDGDQSKYRDEED